MLWEIIDPSYLKTRIDNLDLSISGLMDALRGTGNKTLTDLDTDLSNIYGRLDVALSTRASESTLSGIKTGTDYIDDIYGRIDVLLSTRASESTLSSILGKLDVTLSTRASESTLNTLSNKFTSAVELGDNLSNPTTTIIGGAILGFDGTNWERVMTDGSNRLKVALDSAPNPPNFDITLSALRDALLSGTSTYPGGLDDIYNKLNTQLDVTLSTRASETTLSNIYNRLDVALSTRLSDSKIPNALAQISRDIAGSTVYGLAVIASLAHDYTRNPLLIDDISVTTTESSTAITSPGAKIIKITNKGDTDVLVGIGTSVPGTNPMKVRARTAKIFMFSGATAIFYKTSAGSSTISIEYEW
jgi:hypothetical protein